ncbi:hypothetical protein ACHWQZ_G002992 [Mnemiopsis leidyi]
MLRHTLSRLGVWTSDVVPVLTSGTLPAYSSLCVRSVGTKAGKAKLTAEVVEFDPSEIKSQIPAQVPYTSREADKRSDSQYDRIHPHLYVKHRHTLDPRRYSADVELLEKSALREEIDPAEERYVSRLVLSMKCSCYSTLRSYFIYSHFTAECLEIQTSMEPGKLRTGVYTVNKSPVVHGKHKDRYKRDLWNRVLILHDISGTTADVFLSYVQRNIPAGLTMSVTEERLTELPLDFVKSFYTETNNMVKEEVGDLDSLRSVDSSGAS